MKHGNRNDAYRDTEHEGFPLKLTGNGVCSPKHGKDAEDYEYIGISESMKLEERIKGGEQDAHSPDNPEHGAA